MVLVERRVLLVQPRMEDGVILLLRSVKGGFLLIKLSVEHRMGIHWSRHRWRKTGR